MRVLVDALSVTNLSGRHVFLGHMARLARWTEGTHDFVILHHDANRDLLEALDAPVEWMRCPSRTAGWLGRTLWERARIEGVVRQVGAKGVIGFSGTWLGAHSVPQMSFASNPWCLVPGVPRGIGERVKAGLQRRAYAEAAADVDTLVFASGFLRDAYAANAPTTRARCEVVYPGLDEASFAAAGEGKRDPPPRPRVLTVSVMAPHKNVESVVRAVSALREGHGVDADLALVGPWPDEAYEARIRRLIRSEGLEEVVEIPGRVSTERLHEEYGRASVFCLLSRCESFGIPAVEAQAFGTPVVTSDCCAVPEVCGKGGIYFDPDEVEGVAGALAGLLTDPEQWRRQATRARDNAERFRWDRCSRPLPDLLDRMLARGTA